VASSIGRGVPIELAVLASSTHRSSMRSHRLEKLSVSARLDRVNDYWRAVSER
jgi:hypothetical protein